MSILLLFFFQETPPIADWTWSGIAGMIAACVSGVILFAAFVKAVKDIRTDGWQPFKERWINPWRTRRHAREELLKEVAGLNSKVSEVLKEIKPNGGSSLRDRVDSIGDQVESTAAWIHHQKETSDLPIFKLDEVGRLTFANCAFRELVQAEDGDLTYRKYLSRIELGDRTRFMQELEQSIENLMPLDSTVHFKTEGPHFTAVRMQASPDVRHGGVLKGFFGTACNATPADVNAAIHGTQEPNSI